MFERFVDLFHPGAKFRCLTIDGRLGRTEEVRNRDAGNLDGILHREEQSGTGALVDLHLGDVGTIERHRATRDLVFRVARDRVGKRGLARTVRAHDGVHFAGIHSQIDAPKNFLRTVLGFDRDVQVLDRQGGHF